MWGRCLITGKQIYPGFFPFLYIKVLQGMPLRALNSWVYKIQEKKISTPVYQPSGAAITQYHRLGGLNLNNSGGRKPNTRVPANSVPGESLPPGLLMATPRLRTLQGRDHGFAHLQPQSSSQDLQITTTIITVGIY